LALPGLAMVGEEGPELVEFTRPARVVPAGPTSRILAGAAAQSGPVTINVYVTQSNASASDVGREVAWAMRTGGR